MADPVIAAAPDAVPGRLVVGDDEQVHVATGDGLLRLDRVQWEGEERAAREGARRAGRAVLSDGRAS